MWDIFYIQYVVVGFNILSFGLFFGQFDGSYLWIGKDYGGYGGQIQFGVVVCYIDISMVIGGCGDIDKLWYVRVVIGSVNISNIGFYVFVNNDFVFFVGGDIYCVQIELVGIGVLFGVYQ